MLLAGRHSTWRTLKRSSISLCASNHRGKYKGCGAWQATADLEETNLLLKIPFKCDKFFHHTLPHFSAVSHSASCSDFCSKNTRTHSAIQNTLSVLSNERNENASCTTQVCNVFQCHAKSQVLPHDTAAAFTSSVSFRMLPRSTDHVLIITTSTAQSCSVSFRAPSVLNCSPVAFNLSLIKTTMARVIENLENLKK